MTLDPEYLEYPNRRLGYDHGLYDWSCLFERPAISWPNGKAVAVWFVIDLEWFPLTPTDKPFRAPSHMATPFPDFRNYTAREYGTRIGLYRLLDAFEARGIAVSVAANGAIAERYPEVIEDIVAGGHEIIAHSVDMNHTVATGLPEDEERALIGRTLASLEKVAGTRPRGWLSIARSQSWNTLPLLAEAGIDYACDWVNDELPYRMNAAGGGLVNIPLNHELSDRDIILTHQALVDSYVEQVSDACDWLSTEARTYGGRMLPLNLTPYVMGLPHRIVQFEGLLDTLAARPDIWFARGDALLDAWNASQAASGPAT